MICPACGHEHPGRQVRCPRCGTDPGELELHADHTIVIPDDDEDEGRDGSAPGPDHTVVLDQLAEEGEYTIDDASAPGTAQPEPSGRAGPLTVGATFGERYRIDALLGFGGMGAVYKAWDLQVDIPVALKVVRTDATADPAMTRQLDRRFKRELLLARQVTHKNVVRIHDLGEVDGVKYITMTYIEGQDLHEVLKRQDKVSVRDALKILRPVVAGLAAAHEAGVVHRDLKPANIMIEPATGQSYIMDFGIASTATPTGVEVVEQLAEAKARQRAGAGDDTQAGAVVGTLQYMAPEQFMGKGVDQRADIYSLGLIFYDMLLGRRRIERAESAFAEFRNRIEQSPPSPQTIDPSIPEAVDRIITRCLEPEAGDRFQTTAELRAAFDRLDDDGNLLPVTRRLTRPLVVSAAALMAALVGGTWWLASLGGPTAEPDPMSVLVADFTNTTGDESFDGALEQALVIGMEGAGFISALPPATAHRVAEQIQPGSRLDETMARLVSRREGVSVILAGEIEKSADRYALEVRALDPGVEPGEGKPLAVARASADSRDEVLEAVGRIASELRGDLGDTTPKSDRLAAAETFTAASIEAMSAYAKGQELAAQGRFEQALEFYQRAVDDDPEFGRAYAGMGVAYGNLRRKDAAETSYQKAFQNLDRMNDRERYRTLGGYYLLISKNFDKAIESYRNLVDAYPADAVGHSNLAYAYLSVRDFDRAVESGRQAVALEPKNIINRINYAMYALYAGDFETAIAESRTVLEQDPDFGYALFTIGRAAGAVGDMQAAHDAFEELEASDGMGSSLAPMGHGDLALYRGRNRDAVRLLEPAVAASENPFETASMLVALAEARLALGETEGAVADARRAVVLSEQESVLYFAARLLLAAGRDDEAGEIAIELENRLQSLSTSLSGLIRAELALGDGQLGTALREIRWAREEFDFWMTHYLAGLTYMEAEQYPEAFDEFDHCVRNKGEITDVFLADSATLRYFPPALYWLGRCHEALGNAEAAGERYREYLEIRSDAEPPDELAADAAARLAD